MMNSDSQGPINLGNPEEISMLDLAQWIRDLTGSESDIAFIPRPVDDPQVRKPDISEAKRVLGWEPRTSAETGLKHTIDDFKLHA